MSGRLTKHAYQQLVAEDIAWLLQQPDTLERKHVLLILRHAVEYEYPDPAEPTSHDRDDVL